MDVRHFIANMLAVKLLWQQIQKGHKEIPSEITAITTKYPSLHRDHGIAVRGGISAVLITFIVTGAWILSGWKAGFMMAQMGAITACILTALDNPVPVLRIFIWGASFQRDWFYLCLWNFSPHYALLAISTGTFSNFPCGCKHDGKSNANADRYGFRH